MSTNNENTLQRESEREQVLEYPAHSETFDVYFWLGENRKLKTAARIRFEQLFPSIPPDSPLYKAKFESFYTMVKRWAKREKWDEWVARKELEERTKREAELREKISSVNKIIRSYQNVVRQMILSYTEEIKLSQAYQKALREGNIEEMERLAPFQRAKIKNAKELATLMEFDLKMSERLEQLPDISEASGGKLSEEVSERIDKLMEFIRKRAQETAYASEETEESEEEEDENSVEE